MDEPRSNRFRWLVALAGLTLIAIFTWLGAAEMPAGSPTVVSSGASDATASGSPRAPAGGARIEQHGRLTLERDALPEEGPFSLMLDLPDEARGSGERTVRVVSVDGRRLETRATPMPGAGSGVRLEIDAGFLSPGRYMIEIDTVDPSPLRIRRYVLELK